MTDDREPLVLPQDEFELVQKMAALSATGRPHVRGPRRMVGRKATANYCLSCGQAWPCDGSWQARALAAEARVRELEAALGHFAPAGSKEAVDG